MSTTQTFEFDCEHGNNDGATSRKCDALRHQQSIAKNDEINRDRVLAGPGGNPVKEGMSVRIGDKGLMSMMAVGVLILIAVLMLQMKRR